MDTDCPPVLIRFTVRFTEQSLLKLSVFRVGFDAQFHRLCYKVLAVHYRILVYTTPANSAFRAI